MDSPPTDDFGHPIDTATVGAASRAIVEAPKSPRTLLGADMRFSKGVKVGIGSSSRAMVRAIPEEDLLDTGLELLCRREDMVRLKHELVEAQHNLKQANEANSSYGDRLVRSKADHEFVEARVAKLEKKNQERAIKNAKLKETLERYAS